MSMKKKLERVFQMGFYKGVETQLNKEAIPNETLWEETYKLELQKALEEFSEYTENNRI